IGVVVCAVCAVCAGGVTAGVTGNESVELTARQSGQQAASDPGLERFRSIYKELVETNTTLSAGDCTLAARKMADRLKAAGYPDAVLKIFVPGGHPKEGRPV